MISEQEVSETALALLEAEKSGRQIGLISQKYPKMDMDDAYRIQDAFVALLKADGREPIGWKIGLTSKAMQNALGIDIPDSGVLLDDMLYETGARIPAGRFIEPRVEAEIAFLMEGDVETPTREAIIAATKSVAPAIEILDTRILREDAQTGQARRVFDTISDNAANAGIVLGKARHKVDAFDLRWVGAILKRDGVVEETGLGAAVLDDPVTSMLWLAKRLAQYGQKIRAGDVVLSGSFIRIIEAPSGSAIEADFGEFGSVEVEFE